MAGSSTGLFAKSEAGLLRLKWRLPGAKEQSEEVEVLKSVRVELPTGEGEAVVGLSYFASEHGERWA